MSVWTKFDNRMIVRGGTERNTAMKLEKYTLISKLPKNLSFDDVLIDGIDSRIAIIDTDNLNEKMIYSLPGQSIPHGGLVFWSGQYWLVTELDARDTVYMRAKMIQCNYLLKWVSEDCVIHSQWCIVEDGTKYLTGEYEDRNFIVTRGDSRIAMTIARNESTVRFNRNSRFLVDDQDSESKLAYLLTKPLKVGNVYGENGVYKFVLQEVVTTDDDNHLLGIADYYKYFPKDTDTTDDDNTVKPDNDNDGKKVWI